MAAVSSGTDALNANNLEAAILDVNPDEAIEMRQKQRVLHWDKRKHKYIKTSVAELAEQRGAKKIRTESGVVVRGKDAKQNKGELYDAWKKRSHRAVGRLGEEEAARGPRPAGGGGGAYGRNSGGGGRYGPGGGEVANANAKDELRGKAQMRKEKKKVEFLKLKNMPAAKRRAVASKQKAAYMAKRGAKERSPAQGGGALRRRSRQLPGGNH
ncbi:unnamed protein product [Phaeothamnion confervicola]